MTLDILLELLEKEAGLNRFHRRVNSIEVGNNKELKKRKDKINKYLDKIVSWLYPSRELFGSYVNILNARLDVMEKRSKKDGDEEGQKSLKELAAFIVKTQKNKYQFSDPDFYLMLKAAENMMIEQSQTYIPDFETFGCPLPNLLFHGGNILKDIRNKISQQKLDSFVQYLLKSGGRSPCELWHNLEDFSAFIDAAREEGYENELYSMIDVLACVDSAYLGKNISTGMVGKSNFMGKPWEDGLIGLCRELDDMGKLHYYSRIASRVKEVIRFNPSDAHVMTKYSVTNAIERYSAAGLEDRLLDVLDFAVNTHKKRMETIVDIGGLGHKKIRMDDTLNFWFNFPILYQKLGEKSFDIFSKLYKKFENKINVMPIMEGAAMFYEQKLDKKIDLDTWLGYVCDNIQEAEVMLDFVKGLIEAVSQDISLEHYVRFIPNIERWWLAKSNRTKALLKFEADDNTTNRFIDYCGVLRGISNIPAIKPNNSWLSDVSKSLGIGYRTFRHWLEYMRTNMGSLYREARELRKLEDTDKAVDRRARLNRKLNHIMGYHTAIPLIFENQIDPWKAYALKKHFKRAEDVISLKNIVNSNDAIKAKINFLKKIRKHWKLLTISPPENLDIGVWVEEAKKQAENYFEFHNIHVSYSPDFVVKALNATLQPEARRDLLRAARLEAEHKHTKKLFTPGKVYAEERVYGLHEYIGPVDATRLLLYGLISRREDRLHDALSYYRAEKLSRARAFIQNSRMPPTKFYNKMRKEIDALENSLPKSLVSSAAKDIISKLRKFYLDSQSQAEGKTELRELVWLVESLFNKSEIFDTITAKMQDSILYDLVDGKRLLCCAMLSEDREETEVESLYYLLDPYIGLMHVVPSFKGSHKLPIGAAILANTRSYKNDNVLLVDSMEGGTLFQQIDERKSFRLAAQGILGAAKDAGAGYIVFNTKVPNVTPKRFTHYIGNLLRSESTLINLAKLKDDQITNRQRRYLEAFRDKERLAGLVEGHVIKTSELGDALRYA